MPQRALGKSGVLPDHAWLCDNATGRMLKINDLVRHHAPLADALAARVQAVIASGWLVLGPEVAAFEQMFASYGAASHAIGVGNVTDALELALLTIDVGPCAEIISVANAGMYADCSGAKRGSDAAIRGCA